MSEIHAEVLELPLLDGEKPCRGYTKSQCEVLQGRAYGTIGQEGVRVGRVVGSYAYRYGEGRVQYGLLTEQKFTGGFALWKGSLNREDIELDGNTVLLRGDLARRVKQQLATTTKVPSELLKEVRREVDMSHAMNLSRGRSM